MAKININQYLGLVDGSVNIERIYLKVAESDYLKTVPYIDIPPEDVEQYPDYTPIAPPEASDKFTFWSGETWAQRIDYTGTVLYSKYDKEKYVCDKKDVPSRLLLYTPLEPNQYDEWDAKKETWVFNLEAAKEKKQAEIKEAFHNNIETGSFLSDVLGIWVDCRRSGVNNDLQNAQGLLSYMQRNDVEAVEYVGQTEKKVARQNNIAELIGEMEAYAVALYTKKWELEEQLKAAETAEQIEVIKW